MRKFYHWAKSENVGSILKNGLKTGIELGIQGQYRGIPTNNQFIYLAKKVPDSFREIYTKKDLLLVHIPENHPLERDLDAKVLFESANLNNPFELLNILVLFGQLGVKGDNGTIDIDSPKKIENLLITVSEEKWDEVFSFYRTPLSIPNNKPYKIENMGCCFEVPSLV